MKHTATPFFCRNPWFVLFATIITGGLYENYWTYRQWKAVEEATGTKKHAVWAAIFDWLTWINLSRHINKATKKPVAILLGVLMFVTVLAGLAAATLTEYGPMFVYAGIAAWLLHAVIFAALQSVINTANKAVKPRFTLAETLFTVLAVPLGLLTIAFYAYEVALPPSVLNERLVASEQRLNEVSARTERLSAEYDACLDDLNRRYETLDLSNETEVMTYEGDRLACNDTMTELNDAIAESQDELGQLFKNFLP